MVIDDIDSFNSHSLLLTIMFAFKRLMIVNAMRSRNCKQIWRALRSEISVAFKILVKKLQVADDENELRDILRDFHGHFSHFSLCHFGFSPFLAKPRSCERRNLLPTIMSNLHMSQTA